MSISPIATSKGFIVVGVGSSSSSLVGMAYPVRVSGAFDGSATGFSFLGDFKAELISLPSKAI